MTDWGRFTAAADATGLFESGIPDGRYDYYYSGPGACPVALLGVSKEFKLDAGLWKPVGNEQQLFRELVAGMQSKLREQNASPWGFAIEDGQGRRIGIWYSLPEATTVVRIGNDQTVQIHTPPIDTYLKREL